MEKFSYQQFDFNISLCIDFQQQLEEECRIYMLVEISCDVTECNVRVEKNKNEVLLRF